MSIETGGTMVWVVVPPVNGTDPNADCLALAVTLEDVKACIDTIPEIGQDPDDPTPPGTNYPEEGIGTRFNVRFGLWIVAWVLIFAPLMAMAYRTFPFQYYLYLVISMVFGLGLLFSIVNI